VGLQGLYSRGAITTLGGWVGCGKTPTALRACRAILAGEDFLKFPRAEVSSKFRIVYLTQESEYTFLPAVAAAGLTESLVRGRFSVGMFHDFAQATWPDAVEAAQRDLDGEGLLIVDTQSSWARVTNENDNAVMEEAFKPLLIAAGTGIGIKVITHTRKDFDEKRDDHATETGIRGAGAIIANSTLIFTHKKAVPSLDGDARHLKLHRTRLDYRNLPTSQYTVLEDDGRLRVMDPGLEKDIAMMKEAVTQLHEYVKAEGGQVRKADAAKDLEIDINLALSGLDGIVEQVGKGVRGDPVMLQLADYLDA
jgi:AAA domain